MRSLSAPALLSAELARRARDGAQPAFPASLLASPVAARLLGVLAAGEMLGDKLPFIPDRTDPLPLIGRALSGALVGAAVAADEHREMWLPALVGVAAAVAATFAAHWIRGAVDRRLPDTVVGLAEDGIVMAAGTRLAAAA